MKIVSVDSGLLGRQFQPYLRAQVLPDRASIDDHEVFILAGIDPLDIDLTIVPKEIWHVVQIRPDSPSNLVQQLHG